MSLQSRCWRWDYSCGLVDALLPRLGRTGGAAELEAPEVLAYPQETKACLDQLHVR